MKLFLFLVLIACIPLGIYTFQNCKTPETQLASAHFTKSKSLAGLITRSEKNPESYKSCLNKWLLKKDSLKTLPMKDLSMKIASFIADSAASYWLGTEWDFNGVSQSPQQGQIACGYFVTTLLRDAGFNIQRVKIAQQAAEKIVQCLVSSSNITRYSSIDQDEMNNRLKSMNDGLMVLGLDYHVGFLYKKGDDIRFIHSTVIHPGCVVNEDATRSWVIHASRYKVIGHLSDDAGFTQKWKSKSFISVN